METTISHSPGPKIEFYQQRTLGERITATFDFIRENWKPLFRMGTLLLLPVALLQSAGMSQFLDLSFGDNDLSGQGLLRFSTSYLAVILLSATGYLLVSSLTYTLMQAYDERPDRLAGITFADVRPQFLHNLRRLFLLLAASLAVFLVALVVMFVLAMASGLTLLFTVPALLVLLLPFPIVLPVYVFEPVSMRTALTKGYRLGFAMFWSLLCFVLLLSLLVNVVSSVVTVPYYLLVVTRTLLSNEDDISLSLSLLNFFTYAGGVITTYVTYLLSMAMPIGIAYQYAHAAEAREGMTAERDISNFENLGYDRPQPAPHGKRADEGLSTLTDDIDDFEHL